MERDLSNMRIIRMIIAMALCCAILFIIPTSGYALNVYPTSHVLTIPQVNQPSGSRWCAVACCECVLKYFGVNNVTQYTMVNYIFGDGNPSSHLLDYVDPPTARTALTHYGVSSSLTYMATPFATLMYELYTKSRPTIASYDLTSTMTHSVVIYGYAKEGGQNYIYYRSPAGTGHNYFSLYSNPFVGCSWHYSMCLFTH